MLHNRQNNKKINHLHEKCQRLVQNDKLSSYQELLENYGSVSVYQRNIQGLAIEILQIKHTQSREILLIFLHRQHRSRISEKSRLKDTFCEHSVSWFWKHLLFRTEKLGNCCGKNKWIHFSKQFQKGNQKLSTTKLPWQVSQALYKWCWFPWCLVVYFIFKVLALLFYC